MKMRGVYLNYPKIIRGFSLVELMVALVLGMLLIGGVISLFGGSKATFQANEALARVQENVRFALNELQFESRGVTNNGFCGTRPEPFQHLNVTPGWQEAIFGVNSNLMGWEFDGTAHDDTLTLDAAYPTATAGNWSTRPRQLDGSTPDLALPALFSASATVRPVRDSDVVVVRNLTPIPGVSADASSLQSDARISLNGNHGLAEGELVLVTDCNGADLFRNRSGDAELSRAAGGNCGDCPGNVAPVGSWVTEHQPHMQIYRVQIWGYFVGFNEVRQQPGLYRINLSGCPCGAIEEIVEGVENLQARFGYSKPAPDGDGQTVQAGDWLSADQFEDWWPVISARVSILQRSGEFSGTAPVARQFNLGGTFITSPLDARMRHDASTTIALRNRVIIDD